MKTIIIDFPKWRCGSNGPAENKNGIGKTCLRDKRTSEMCCLGFGCLQLNSNVTPEMINDLATPAAVDLFVDDLCQRINKDSTTVNNSGLSMEAMRINDDETTTVQYKMSRLSELFLSNGIQLEFQNVPEHITKS